MLRKYRKIILVCQLNIDFQLKGSMPAKIAVCFVTGRSRLSVSPTNKRSEIPLLSANYGLKCTKKAESIDPAFPVKNMYKQLSC
jgi:hypothetical protein